MLHKFKNNLIRTLGRLSSSIIIPEFNPASNTINSFHFELIKPELYLFIILITVLLFSVRLRNFFRPADILYLSIGTVITGLLGTLFFLVKVSKNIQETKYIIFNGALLVDHFTITIKIFIVLLTIFFLIGVMHNLLVSNIDIVEYPILIGFSTLFLLVIVSVNNLIVLYLALEGLSFMLYALTLLPFNLSLYQLIPLIKYFTSGAVSSGFLLFSILIFHAKTGSFDLDTISYTYKNFSGVDTMSFIGITAVLFGFLFKLAVFPCHMWSLDVYEGAWLPTTLYFMVVVKTGIFFTFLRLFVLLIEPLLSYSWHPLLFCSVVGSLLVGSIGALTQTRLKRIFAYSSISQLGFCLLGFISDSPGGLDSAVFFFLVYILTTAGIFLIILNTESFIKGHRLVSLSDLTKFKIGNPIMAIILSIFLLSLAGLPPLLGFFSKLLIFKELVSAQMYVLCIFSILCSIINSFVYIRLVKCLFFDRPVTNNSTMVWEKDFFLRFTIDRLWTFRYWWFADKGITKNLTWLRYFIRRAFKENDFFFLKRFFFYPQKAKLDILFIVLFIVLGPAFSDSIIIYINELLLGMYPSICFTFSAH